VAHCRPIFRQIPGHSLRAAQHVGGKLSSRRVRQQGVAIGAIKA
jgi:hypothetical protein